MMPLHIHKPSFKVEVIKRKITLSVGYNLLLAKYENAVFDTHNTFIQ